MTNNCTSVVLYGVADSITVSENNYILTQNEFETALLFKEKSVIKEIEKIGCEKVVFCMDGVKFTAKSNPILSSRVPEQADYFFSVNTDGSILTLKDDSTLYMRKISK